MKVHKFRTTTVQHIVYIACGFIMVIGLVSILVIYKSLSTLQEALRQMALIEQPIAKAAYEMEINIIGIGQGVLAYLDTTEQVQRERVSKDTQDFERFQADYERLAKSPTNMALSRSIKGLYNEYLGLGRRLMDNKDKQAKLLVSYTDRFSQISKLMLQLSKQEGSASGFTRKSAVFREILEEIAEAETLFAKYSQTQDKAILAPIFALGHSLEILASSLKESAGNKGEKNLISGIYNGFGEMGVLSKEVLALNETMATDINALLDLRQRMDDMLDDHIQEQSAYDLLQAIYDSEHAITKISWMNTVIQPLSLLLILVVAGSMVWLIRRPVKAIKARAANIIEGGFGQRLSVRPGDEFSELAEYFNQLLDRSESAMVSKVELEVSQQKLELTNQDLQKEVEQRKVMQQYLRKLNRKLIATQETERRTIARELHDEIGQSLSALKINLQSFKTSSSKPLPRFEDSLAILERTLTQVRSLSLNLRPPLLDDLGLVPTLRWFLDQQAQRVGFKLRYNATPNAPRLPPDLENTCFRIVQEAVTNISRYAMANNVWVNIEQTPESVGLIIGDDGVGFDVETMQQNPTIRACMGLLGMEERAALVGGRIQITSVPGEGTQIHAILPISAEEYAL
jgi:signal transduction histidine kinase